MNSMDLIKLIEHDRKGADVTRTENLIKVRKWTNAYNGKAYGNEEKGRSGTVWKLIKKQGESLISNMSKQFLGGHEIVDLTPLTVRDTFKAGIYF